MSRLHRFADACDRVAGLAACLADRHLNLPHGLVDLTLGLQLVVAGQRADRLLDLPFAWSTFPARSFLFHI